MLRMFLLGGCLAASVTAAKVRWVLMDPQRLTSDEVLFLNQDDLGNKYYATHKGLTWVNKGGDYQIFTKDNTKGSLGSDSITSLGVDRYRGLWIGTDGGGVSVFSNQQWTHYTQQSTQGGLPDNGVLDLAVYNEERWIATRNGFALLRGNVWTTYTGDRISGRLPNRSVTAIAVDSLGQKWIGTIGGLVKFKGSTWVTYTHENTQGGLPHNGITHLVVDSLGRVWVGTQTGVARLDRDGKWTNYQNDPALGELAGAITYSLSLGAKGEVWACLKGGAARFSDGHWQVFTKNNTSGLQTRYLYYVLSNADGEVSFATAKGVATMIPVADEE